jgi:uncharacterized repeat protein (TIGR02543 family)
MPSNNVTVTVNWTQDETPPPPPPPTYKVIVEDSYAGARVESSYAKGATVNINAGTKKGYTFAGWTVTSGGVTLVDANSVTTSFIMPSNDVTVTAKWTANGYWALINLILCITGALVALFIAIKALFRKDKDKDDRKYKQQSDYKNTGEYEYEMKKTSIFWLIVTIVMGIAGVVVFLLTENMRLPMRLVDWWTIVNAIIFIIGFIGAMLVFKHEKKNDWDKGYKSKSA